ncbi:MAG TPA: cupin domain-containing protein [Sphingopyxis sp.]|nr:cupin domain-containing protein [Sphingopyxis sp.]
MAEGDRKPDAAPFRIYRGADAPDLHDTGRMTLAGLTPIVEAGVGRWVGAGVGEGNVTRVLFALPHMSLTYAWFKSGFALPLHSHDADCLYYVIAGSLRLGTEELGAGDGFFVGRDVPYSYRPGPDGVEVLEFRTVDAFDMKFQGRTEAYWDKIVAGMDAARPQWDAELPPSQKAAL